MSSIDYRSGVPICDQITEQVIRLKIHGILKAGDKLPSVRQAAIDLGVNPNTIQKAYTLLFERGIIVSINGKGSFISEDDTAENAIVAAAKNNIKKALEEAKRVGLSFEDTKDIAEEIFRKEDNL